MTKNITGSPKSPTITITLTRAEAHLIERALEDDEYQMYKEITKVEEGDETARYNEDTVWMPEQWKQEFKAVRMKLAEALQWRNK